MLKIQNVLDFITKISGIPGLLTLIVVVIIDKYQVFNSNFKILESMGYTYSTEGDQPLQKKPSDKDSDNFQILKMFCVEKLCGRGKKKAKARERERRKKKLARDKMKVDINEIEDALLKQFDLKKIIKNLTFLMHNQQIMLKRLKVAKSDTAQGKKLIDL